MSNNQPQPIPIPPGGVPIFGQQQQVISLLPVVIGLAQQRYLSICEHAEHSHDRLLSDEPLNYQELAGQALQSTAAFMDVLHGYLQKIGAAG